MRVRVHWNVRRKAYSILHGGRVIGYQSLLKLTDCKFIVLPGGQARARKEIQRNVHAFVEGEWEGVQDEISLDLTGKPVTYRYDKYNTFVTKEDERPILHAEKVELTTNYRVGEGKTPYIVAY
jgi:hypothetical protein